MHLKILLKNLRSFIIIMSKELFEYQKELDQATKAGGWFNEICMILADAEQTFKFMDVKRKTFLAKLTEEVTQGYSTKISVARAETMAMSSSEYRSFLDGYGDAMKKYFEYKYKYETVKNRIDALRTFISLEKGKMGVM